MQLTNHLAMDASLTGSLAFVAYSDVLFGLDSHLQAAGLGIIDCSDPTHRDTVGIHALGRYASPRAVSATSDTTVYVAAGFKDLFVFDCSPSESAHVVGEFVSMPWDTNYANDVFVSDGPICLGDGYAWTDNFSIFDSSVPDSAMQPLGSMAARNITWGLSVEDSVAHIAEKWAGLSVVRCSNRASPSYLTNYDIGGYAQSVHLEGNRAYVGCQGGSLRVVDFSDSERPFQATMFDSRGRASDAWVLNDTAYIAEGFNRVQGPSGLEVADFAHPPYPTLIGSFDPGDSAEFFDVEMVGRILYIADGIDGLRVLDVTDPTDPGPTSTPSVRAASQRPGR